ncbi:MAG: phosphate ABC transporter substrate-binding protein [Vicinamibacterales bacterium]
MPVVQAFRILTVAVSLLGVTAACSSSDPSATNSNATSSSGTLIRVTGSDTMVNLVQAWAENYKKARPEVAVQVAGGGSGVGIAGLINGIVDIAASSREMEPNEIEKAKKTNGQEPKEYTVALDALSIYAHKSNPLETIAIEELAEIYGDGAKIVKWSQLNTKNAACASDAIIRVSRQNNSGTFVYFREAVLGREREYKMGSIDQSGSKDVVTLVSRTPCAVGYSGMAYATPDVKELKVAKKKGEPAVAASAQTAIDGTYPLARKLYLYTRQEPTGQIKDFLDWVTGAEGQKIVEAIGYVPVAK